MTLDELNEELRPLISQPASFKRNAANSLILYFYGEPGDPEVISFFIDPTWRFERHGRIVIGSYDFQIRKSDFDSEESYRLEWDRRCDLMSGLIGSLLEGVEVSPLTGDLLLRFADSQIVRSFANSPFHEDTWTYRNMAKKIKVKVSPLGIRVEQIGERKFVIPRGDT